MPVLDVAARSAPRKKPSESKKFQRIAPWASLVARLAGAALFGYAAAAKIGDPAGTVRAVRAYRLLPESLIHPVAYALPAFEIALATLLLVGVATRLVGAIAVAVVALFGVAIATAAARGLQIDCGCFGGGGSVAHTRYPLEIGRDVALLLVLSIVPLATRSRWSIDGYAARRADGILVGNASAPVRLIAYEDPQCPICKDFEQVNGATLKHAINSGEVSVEYRMRSFLGPESVRADNALAAAQKQGKFEALREALFAHQPQERTGGFTTDQLLALGRSVGLAGQEFVNDVRSMTYAGWVAFVDDQASRDGNVGTPEVIKVGSGALRSEQLFTPAGFKVALGLE